ncbi:MAG: UbiA family prenyltransferase [bacterium]|nr:UbiA family prenyltransferase [bacterium]
MMHFFDYVFLLRPALFVPVWTFFLLGFYRGTSFFDGPEIHQILKPFTLAFVLYTLLMGGVYILNQIIDIESDRINKKLYLLSEGYIPVKQAWIWMMSLFAAALTLSIPFTTQFKIILLLSLLIGILYSVPPFKFKGRPILDLLSNSFGYGTLAFSLGWLVGNPFSKETLIFSLPYFFAVGAVFLNTTIPDIEGDRKTNELTTGVLLGERRIYWLSTVFLFISLGFAICLKDWLCVIACCCSIPLFILALIKHNLKTCFISIRIGAPILVILIGIKFIWFIPLLIILFLAIRIYYKYRFNIIYPKIV